MRAGMLKRLIAYLTIAAVLFAPLIVWLISVKNPVAYLIKDVPPGQALYIVSKLAGLFALCAFWGQCILALAARAPVLREFPTVRQHQHKVIGLLTLVLVLTHISLFFVAASLRGGAPAWTLLWPNFSHGYYNAMVSLGLIAVWLLLLGVYAGWRTARGSRAWKKVHMIWFAVFLLVFIHAYAIGSESRYGAMRYVLLFIATSLVAATLSRIGIRARAKWAVTGMVNSASAEKESGNS